MNDKRSEVLRRFFIAAPCRSLLAVLCGVVMLLTVGSSAMALHEDLPAGVVHEESGYYYTVQKGDTLWDLSRRFADTPFYWPQLWKENEQIPNPHRIFPGDRIRIFRRAWAEPLVSPEPGPVPVAQDTDVRRLFYFAGIEAVGFIRREPVPPTATVFKLTEDRTISGRWESILVRPADGVTLLPGQQFSVYRTFEPIVDKDDKPFVGYQHYLLGVVEITDASGDLASAAVIRSFRDIHAGDKLMPRPDPLPDPRIVLSDSKPGIQGKILRPEEDLTNFGDHTVVFINRGEKDGIASGQRYTVCDPAEIHMNQQTQVRAVLPRMDIGSILVLHAEAETATALVVRSDRDISAGAPIMTPE